MLAAILTTFAKSHSPQRKPGLANRLWAYQLQEEELKKDEKVDEPPRSVDEPEVVAKKNPVRKKLSVPKRSPSVEREVPQPIPFIRKRVQTTPSAYEMLSDLEPLSLTFSSVLALKGAVGYNVLNLEAERIKRRQRARRRAAAFLLLAA